MRATNPMRERHRPRFLVDSVFMSAPIGDLGIGRPLGKHSTFRPSCTDGARADDTTWHFLFSPIPSSSRGARRQSDPSNAREPATSAGGAPRAHTRPATIQGAARVRSRARPAHRPPRPDGGGRVPGTDPVRAALHRRARPALRGEPEGPGRRGAPAGRGLQRHQQPPHVPRRLRAEELDLPDLRFSPDQVPARSRQVESLYPAGGARSDLHAGRRSRGGVRATHGPLCAASNGLLSSALHPRLHLRGDRATPPALRPDGEVSFAACHRRIAHHPRRDERAGSGRPGMSAAPDDPTPDRAAAEAKLRRLGERVRAKLEEQGKPLVEERTERALEATLQRALGEGRRPATKRMLWLALGSAAAAVLAWLAFSELTGKPAGPVPLAPRRIELLRPLGDVSDVAVFEWRAGDLPPGCTFQIRLFDPANLGAPVRTVDPGELRWMPSDDERSQLPDSLYWQVVVLDSLGGLVDSGDARATRPARH